MESAIIIGASAIFLLNIYRSKRGVKSETTDGTPSGTQLPPPRFLYSDPALWVSSPVEISDLPSQVFWGPYNDPRRALILPGGSKVVHSGLSTSEMSSVRTNWPWSRLRSSEPVPVPMYKPSPQMGIGEPQMVTDNTFLST